MKAPAPSYDTEQRFLLGTMTCSVLLLVGVPTIDLLFFRDSWSFRLSITTEFPRLIALGFAGACGCIVPLLYCFDSRWALRLACLGGCIGAFASYGMAYVSRNVDVGPLLLPFLNWFAFYFVLAGTVSWLYAAMLAVLLNSQMLRALTTREVKRE